MTKGFWNGRRVLVTGGNGFLGSHVVARLQARGCRRVSVPRRATHDLRREADLVTLFEAERPDLVIHLAASVGGIEANRKNPGAFFYDNALMGIQLMERARASGVTKSVWVGTVCSYPKDAKTPFHERDFWSGYPDETNAPYGLAKKMLLVQLQAYEQQYGFRGIYLIPANLYGPGDTFDLERSHVIPALIRKCVEAKRTGQPQVIAWGTGRATRDFLYVEDAAEAIVEAAERYEKSAPLNLGSGDEVSIREVAELIRTLVGFQGAIEWDATRPDGQPRRSVDAGRARQELGWRARTPLREGLQKTIEWFLTREGRAESLR